MLYSKLWKSTKKHDIWKFWTKHGLTCLLWDTLFWARRKRWEHDKIRASKLARKSAQNQWFWRVFYDKMHALRWFWCVFLKGIVHFQQLADDRATAASGWLGRTATSLHFYTFQRFKSFQHNFDPTFYSAYFDEILLIQGERRDWPALFENSSRPLFARLEMQIAQNPTAAPWKPHARAIWKIFTYSFWIRAGGPTRSRGPGARARARARAKSPAKTRMLKF